MHSIYDKMKDIVGEKNVSDNYFELINNTLDPFPYELDLEAHEKLPYLVVKPKDEKEVSEIFKLANRENIPVYPRGSGTSFTGSARASEKGIILSTSRMNFIDINTDDGYFECGPGVTVNSVDLSLGKRGFFLPILPGMYIRRAMC